ncbi:Armadillo repeat-containing kinesin-like protein 1, partial [Ananas comosus]
MSSLVIESELKMTYGTSFYAGRVRVAVRLRPRNAEDFPNDSDFASCVELQPESVLDGYNGTVMAYGQTGTGKTYTVGRLGKDDPSERGIMVRALEDILASTSSRSDSVAISYLQMRPMQGNDATTSAFRLYLESLQDLLAPEKTNIPIVEDPKTGEVSLPGAAVVDIRNLDHFVELLQIGEANRHAANTKLNTESSRSHAMLVVHIQRSLKEKEENDTSSVAISDESSSRHIPLLLKSKLLIVDLAGSERIDKS